MFYYEILGDGTVVGLFDGTRSEGEIVESAYWSYHERIARREHPATRGHVLNRRARAWPLSAIDNAIVRTALISTYRVHSKKYFLGGSEFPKMWEPRGAKITASERFSAPGTIGYYFGLTVDGALDEARYYAGSHGDLENDQSKIILVHRTYYTDLLYLAPVLLAVWEHLGLPQMSPWETYIAIMDPNTNNKITDAIGTWARDYGFQGIIYPSARYGQNLNNDVNYHGHERFPVLNFVEIGSHLCEEGLAIQLTLSALGSGLAGNPPKRPPAIVYSEPNIVIFNEQAAAGLDRPVFYATYPISEAGVVRGRDERLGLKHHIDYGCDESKNVLSVNDARFRYLLEIPR